MKIFLGDLVHTWGKGGIWTIPLNVGYVASYASHFLGARGIDCEFRIFKDPIKMIDAIKDEKPDVVGLSYYVWNMNLNSTIFDIVKKYVPKSFTVAGGPCFTSQNADEMTGHQFFSKHQSCDAYVINQGEKGFAELIKSFCETGKDLEKLRTGPVKGSLINDLKKNDRVHVGEDIGALDDLNDIPSPYLSGMLDPFFDGPYLPLLETNRSCPYRCTFCAWGIGTGKLKVFDEKRVAKEIDYISERCKNATTLFIADANFGILERDARIAEKIYSCHQKHGFPRDVAVQWNKTRIDRVSNTAKAFKSLSPVGASMQSLNPDVLKAIKRKNLPLDKIINLQKELADVDLGDRMFSELIIGLPLETKKSHIEANRKLIDAGFEVWNYNLHLLPGTEMDTKESRDNFFKKVGWRLHSNAYGIYDGEKVFEGQETVLETTTLSRDDFRYFRFYHFLQQMMWSKRWYYDLLIFLKKEFVHPVDVIDKIIQKCQNDIGGMGKLYRDFMSDYNELETFETYEDLHKFWSDDANFERLANGNYGKLNMLYTYKIILDHRNSFNEMVLGVVKDLDHEREKTRVLPINGLGLDIEAVKDILKYQDKKFVKFDDDLNVVRETTETFNYDILKWQKSAQKTMNKSKNTLRFFISDYDRKTLEIQLEQFKSKNLNAALRNMTVYTDSRQFFYEVEYK